MPVYFYLSPEGSRATQEAVMAFTHDDVYKPVPGYKVMVSHFHFHLNEQLTDAGLHGRGTQLAFRLPRTGH